MVHEGLLAEAPTFSNSIQGYLHTSRLWEGDGIKPQG
jgi:hypothetical protein